VTPLIRLPDNFRNEVMELILLADGDAHRRPVTLIFGSRGERWGAFVPLWDQRLAWMRELHSGLENVMTHGGEAYFSGLVLQGKRQDGWHGIASDSNKEAQADYILNVITEQAILHPSGPVIETLSRMYVLFQRWRTFENVPRELAEAEYFTKELEDLPGRWWEMPLSSYCPRSRPPPRPPSRRRKRA
jgi:hypothetical protein